MNPDFVRCVEGRSPPKVPKPLSDWSHLLWKFKQRDKQLTLSRQVISQATDSSLPIPQCVWLPTGCVSTKLLDALSFECGLSSDHGLASHKLHQRWSRGRLRPPHQPGLGRLVWSTPHLSTNIALTAAHQAHWVGKCTQVFPSQNKTDFCCVFFADKNPS